MDDEMILKGFETFKEFAEAVRGSIESIEKRIIKIEERVSFLERELSKQSK